MFSKESESIARNYLKNNLTLFNDRIFSKAVQNKKFVEELLQVIFNDSQLKVIKCEVQKTFNILDQRGIRLDCLCELQNGERVSVEVEKNDSASKWDDQRRVRYYGSIINVMSLKKKEIYDHLPDVYMVYLTTKDIFKKGKTIYHVERCLKECNEFVDNGYHEIYVNAENYDNSDIAEVMKIMSTKEYLNPKFKEISKTKEEKLMPVEVEKAFKEIKDSERADGIAIGKAEGKIEGMMLGQLKAIVKLLRQGLISEEVALSNLELSKEELDKKIKELNI